MLRQHAKGDAWERMCGKLFKMLLNQTDSKMPYLFIRADWAAHSHEGRLQLVDCTHSDCSHLRKCA